MKISREDIHLITRHSNWSESQIDQALKTGVYSDAPAWQKFIKLFCISLGITFATLGITFFFAYNWADLHKFIKIGLVQGLMIAASLVAVVPKIDWKIRRIILMGASMLVGVLFAVFGQVYQTGANAYDFFLGWTVFIAIWVLVSNFAPLWLMFLVLINTTFILYTEQVLQGWQEIDLMAALFMINIAFAIIATILQYKLKKAIPSWFIRVVAMAAICFATMVICFGIVDGGTWMWGLTLLLAIGVYSAGLWYGLKTKDRFYLAAIPFSGVVICSTILGKAMDNEPILMFFIISLFVVLSVTFLVKTLIHLQKQWSNE